MKKELMNKSVVPDNVMKDQVDLHNYFEQIEGKKNYSDFPEMSHNPFICLLNDDLQLRLVKKGYSGDVSSAISTYVNEDTGERTQIKESKGGSVFSEFKYVDPNEFTKIYKKNLKEMFSLSSTALKLFGYFIGQLDHKDRDGMVYMSLQDGIDFCEYGDNSKSLVYRGLIELILKGFICKTNRPWAFYVNPKYIHNGDRIAVFKEYIMTPIKSDNSNNERSIENW